MPIEREFLERFLEEHLHRLRAFVRLRMPPELRSRESDSDVLQVACLQVLQRGANVEYRSDGALMNWLFGAVENAVRELLRHQRAARRDPAREARDGTNALLESYATFCTPSRVAGAREEVERIERAMDALSPAQRNVVVSSCLLGLSHAEIAARTGMSAESVRTHLHRGLARLAVLVDGSGGGAT